MGKTTAALLSMAGPAGLAGLLSLAASRALADGAGGEAGAIGRAGSGSYRLSRPTKAREPQEEIWLSERVRGPVPTGDWWSSLVWTRFSEPMFAHPLALRAEARGLRVAYPGASIAVNKTGIVGGMPGGDSDIVLGHSQAAEFPDARCDGWSDWFVSALFQQGASTLRASFGHGSPFVFALFEGGEPRLQFAQPPRVWSGDPTTPTVGISIGGRHWGLFAPRGSSWQEEGDRAWRCRTNGKGYFSLALLPDDRPETLRLFARHAHAHVVGSRVDWRYDAPASRVHTRFSFETRRMEAPEAPEAAPENGAADDANNADGEATLFALYPHQWTRLAAEAEKSLLPHAYRSVRGDMKLARGAVFETGGTFTGVLPALPDAGSYDRAVLTRLVEEIAAEAEPPGKDTYWDGKYLGRLAAALPIAEQLRSPAAAAIEERLKRRLEDWLRAEENGRLKETNTFYLNRRWGTLIGYPASYGSDHELSDHHFHYGYFLRAAAEVARRDPAWAARWKPMVDLLARDIASPTRDDPNFPFLRVFDPYAGHSWASGTAKFGSGNNHESSSEAMAAWTGLILWGQATGDTALRDTGVYLYTTEMEGINNYWFDVDARNRPREYEPSVITMVWGGKGVNETWFSKNPEAVHGINWLPFHGGSLYLGRHPEYLRRNYDALVRENGGANWDQWADIVWMARALSDPDDAWAQLEASRGTFKAEDGNSRANLVHWVGNLREMGQVDPAVTADYPLYVVFHKGAARTYIAYNTSNAPLNVAFSDGTTLAAPTRGWHTLRQTKPNP